ncbi:hypothetical protein DACRYDRAFT_107810 [Dacryopinax primogenitus]|uniref:Uncharacterized protein n=1 Tax=Dacryopinax primogenitus (strain DJM 731) TaxID=1858805 RepID=M5FXP0_DACPD|nr:uncharacterized protein DACRYDRAFT_107810 [Dacryopinax primogenitus]EJU01254.1 hypothetical protein DACRYDRAFT_107810 [Dacryopinax primogenitus]
MFCFGRQDRLTQADVLDAIYSDPTSSAVNILSAYIESKQAKGRSTQHILEKLFSLEIICALDHTLQPAFRLARERTGLPTTSTIRLYAYETDDTDIAHFQPPVIIIDSDEPPESQVRPTAVLSMVESNPRSSATITMSGGSLSSPITSNVVLAAWTYPEADKAAGAKSTHSWQTIYEDGGSLRSAPESAAVSHPSSKSSGQSRPLTRLASSTSYSASDGSSGTIYRTGGSLTSRSLSLAGMSSAIAVASSVGSDAADDMTSSLPPRPPPRRATGPTVRNHSNSLPLRRADRTPYTGQHQPHDSGAAREIIQVQKQVRRPKANSTKSDFPLLGVPVLGEPLPPPFRLPELFIEPPIPSRKSGGQKRKHRKGK